MFVSLRDKFTTVQEGITARVRGFSEPPRKTRLDVSDETPINHNAGAYLLNKYQTDWSELHQLSETNAVKAQELDTMIGSMHQELEKKWTSVSQISISLAAVPQLLNGVQEMMEHIGQLQQLCDDVESGLSRLEDTVEMQELQERQLDHRFQLAMYKEKKLAGLESLRSGLVTSHTNKLQQHEVKQQQLSKERQATFDEAFKQDVQHYKQSGSIPKLGDSSRGPSLEEVILHFEEDSLVLDKFLQEESEA